MIKHLTWRQVRTGVSAGDRARPPCWARSGHDPGYRRSLRRIHTTERESARDQGGQQGDEGRPGAPFRTGPVAGQSRARTRSSPCPLVLAALLVGAVGARVALAPSRSDAAGALAPTVETWIIFGRGGQHGLISLGKQRHRWRWSR
jgi:hypothetical protein